MKVNRLFMLVAIILLGAISSNCWSAEWEVGKETLTKDTVWEGDVLVTGDVHVPVGVTLTIAPGTKVRFKKIAPTDERNMFGVDSPYYPQGEIIVTGKMIAKGTPEKPIIFTSAEAKPQPADWGTLNILGSTGNVIENCRIEYAYNGVHSHGGVVLIRNNTFSDNAVAISVKKEEDAKGTPGFGISADITVTGNLIENNKGGINVRVSRAVITKNTIRGNKFFGIWVKEKCQGEISGNEITANQKGIFFYKAEGMNITSNNIYDNVEYNLAIADEQAREVPVSGNWFGTTDRSKIEALLFDGRSDPTIAKIIVEPFLTAPVKDAGK